LADIMDGMKNVRNFFHNDFIYFFSDSSSSQRSGKVVREKRNLSIQISPGTKKKMKTRQLEEEDSDDDAPYRPKGKNVAALTVTSESVIVSNLFGLNFFLILTLLSMNRWPPLSPSLLLGFFIKWNQRM